MALIYHYQSIVFFSQFANFVELGYGAIHAESAIGNYNAVAAAFGSF